MLRQWREADLEPFAKLNADPEVMRYFPSTLDAKQSDALAGRARLRLEQQGWGLWALEVRGGVPFIGFVGLASPPFEAHFTPAVEVGWRLARGHWGNGYATEGAHAALAFGFENLRLDEVVSFATPANQRSRNVMERLGMSRDPADDFEHPLLPRGWTHVLYRLDRAGWISTVRGAPIAGQ